MPRVPQLEGPSVRRDPMPIARVSAPTARSAGADFAQGLAQVGEVISAKGRELAEIEAKEIATRAEKAMLEVGYGDGGLYTKRGKAALDAAAAHEETLGKMREEALKNTRGGAYTERILGPHIDDLILSEQARAARFLDEQRRAYDDDTSAGRIIVARERAARRYDEPEEVAEALRIVDTEARARSARQGLDGDALEAVVTKERSDAIEALLQSAIANDPANSRRYYQKYAAGLTADKRATFRTAIDRADRGARATAIAGLIFERGGARSQMNEAVADIDDPQLKEAVRIRLNRLFTAEDKADEQARRDQRDATWERVYNDPRMTADQIPAGLGRTEGAMREYLAKRDAGVKPKTKPERYVAWQEMSDSELALQNPLEWKADLDEADFQEFSRQWGELRRGTARGPVKATGGVGKLTRDDITREVNKLANSLGIPHGVSAAREDNARYSQLDRWVRERAAAEKDLDLDGLYRIVDSAAEEIVTSPGRFWDSTSLRFELDALPVQTLPESQGDLVEGAIYSTARGPARWNGTAFEKVE